MPFEIVFESVQPALACDAGGQGRAGAGQAQGRAGQGRTNSQKSNQAVVPCGLDQTRSSFFNTFQYSILFNTSATFLCAAVRFKEQNAVVARRPS